MPAAAGARNVVKVWPDDRTRIRFNVQYNMLLPIMAETAAIPSQADVQVYNLNGGLVCGSNILPPPMPCGY